MRVERTCSVEGCNRVRGRHGARGLCSKHYKRLRAGHPLEPAAIGNYRSFEERFWAAVRITAGCWEWTGALNSSGYGEIGIEGGRLRAHRASWTLHRGSIPEGLWVLHHCDNRRCVNPDHLYLGTALDNARDMHSRGRARPPRGSRQGGAVLTEEQVLDMRRRYEAGGWSHNTLAAAFGVASSTVQHVLERSSWRHV